MKNYREVVKAYVGDVVLANNIVNIDESVWDNMEFEGEEYPEIYQYYLCNVSDYAKEEAQEYGLIFSYSDKLECDVLCVDHFGTSWDIVPVSKED